MSVLAIKRDAALKVLRRWRRREERAEGSVHGACWHSVASVRRAIIPGGGQRSDNDAVRGLLIKLVAAGDVEVCEFANGVGWRSAAPLYLPSVAGAERWS